MGRLRNSGAAGAAQVPHRPGPLVQSNKKHKFGKHRTKGMIDQLNSGRVAGSDGSKSNKRRGRQALRAERRKQSAALRNQKVRETVQIKRAIGGGRGAPISICCIPLSSTTNCGIILGHMLKNVAAGIGEVVGACGNSTHLKLKNGKNLTLTLPNHGSDLWVLLDLVKMSDVVLFLLPILEPLAPEAVTLLKCIKDQGITTPFLGVSQEFTKHDEKQFLKSLLKTHALPTSIDKIYPLNNPGQISNLLRMISVAKIQLPKSSSLRSGMVIESMTPVPVGSAPLDPSIQEQLGPLGQLVEVTGIVRRQNLNPRQPVHIPGQVIGNWQILRVDVVGIGAGAETPNGVQVPPRYLIDAQVLAGADELDAEMEDDEMSVGTMEDVDQDDLSDSGDDSESGSDSADSGEKIKKKPLLPKGTSDYQADWFDDDEAGPADQDQLIGSDEELESDSDDKSTLGSDHADEKSEGDEDEMDWIQEQKELQLAKDARTESEFPDWIDTPLDIPAKVRFQRYRGLQSFKTSPWDPNENLPKEYNQVIQFGNYRHTYKKVVGNKAERDGPGWIPVGQRVKILLRPIGPGAESGPIATPVGFSKPTILHSLFPHETKLSVLNLHLNVTEVFKNKESLIFQVGNHRFTASPILSEVSTGNKHKMLRYAQPGLSCMATIICPIIFPPAPVLVFKMSGTSGTSGAGITGPGNLTHVASGSVFSIDPSRIIAKRVLLSGFPYKSHGRKTTVRFMFFNREDIEWFKPIELRTRYGRRGHIKEPLGTHGHMKCIFDGPIKSQDTVLLPLYKRVFPKLNYEPICPGFSVFEHY